MSAASGTLPNDPLLVEIADYVDSYRISSERAHETARYCLMDSIACALEALQHAGCAALLGPTVPGASVVQGARVPGTQYMLDPVTAAFDIGCMIRWLDYSDTFVTTPTTTHPSDDLGAIWAVADYLSRVHVAAGEKPLLMKTVLDAMIKAHEIQGVLASQVDLTGHGIDHVLLPKVACAATIAKMLGGSHEQIVAATSFAFFEVGLCVHRFGSNTGPRKGWAAAAATSQAVWLAHAAIKGEAGYPQVLTHPQWGFYKRFLNGEAPPHGNSYTTQVMENIVFKLVGPVVIHAQSAVECALRLHGQVRDRLDQIETINIATHHEAFIKINKTGPLRNAADRDHCMQYAVAVALLHGRLTAEDYEDEVAGDPRIDRLRALMKVEEEPRYSEGYRDPNRRTNANAIEIRFRDGSSAGPVELEYPRGHPARRAEGVPALIEKFERGLALRFPADRQRAIRELCMDHQRLENTPVNEFSDLFVG